MDIQRQCPGVHWVWEGGISFVYEVHPLKSGEEEREQFHKELKIYEILSQHPPCPSVVQCFLYTTDGIFLEYMRDISLAYRKQFNMTRNQETRVVTKVNTMEPLPLRKQWMNDLAQGVAFLGSLNLAHGDLRAENILLDRDQLKLSDFDCTAEFGTDFETCPCPYGRLLNDTEAEQGRPGTAGFLGPRTEQFALGSLYYLINYGFEVYDDQCLAGDPYEHGPKVVDLLQRMEFPSLDGDPVIDDIIDKCWHNQYPTLAELASHTEALLKGSSSEVPNPGADSTPTSIPVDRIPRDNGKVPSDDCRDVNQNSGMHFSKQEFCRDLEKRGLLRLLTSGTPTELGFRMEHRYVLETTPVD
ncbi:kinase-like domain-containing protein [Aspergillus avenaceus]|uniref:Kinase-like domain-containing protein n=1 Tax=Aspergillus avenaceus TaxID=36643 RepID=A0A5N6U8P3_ASPAV|nr:kinase-like domain-containing protein [Aspergillus avenaceus]